jgi:hypothetical protein
MDLDSRVDALVTQILNFGEGTIELPEMLTLDDRVDPLLMLDCFQLIHARCLAAIPGLGQLRYHPMEQPGHLWFHQTDERFHSDA